MSTYYGSCKPHKYYIGEKSVNIYLDDSSLKKLKEAVFAYEGSDNQGEPFCIFLNRDINKITFTRSKV